MNAAAPKTTAVATTQPRSVLINMSERYGMEPSAFEATVRATCMPPDKNGRVPTKEEFAAFLLVAKEYKLNPITKEIYAFSGRGGGIVPIVSLDGWANLINSHGQLNGMKFEMHHDDDGQLVACTCTIWRKDREHPIEITEYLSECIRNTDPWKMKHRMLRHKSLIQCARYAFGFAGIYDEDEGERIIEMQRADPPKPPRPDQTPPKPTASPPNEDQRAAHAAAQKQPPKPANDSELAGKQVEDAQVEEMSFDRETGEIVEETGEATDAIMEGEDVSPSDMLTAMDDEMSTAVSEAAIHDIWNRHDILARLTHTSNGDEFVAIAKATFARHLKRTQGHAARK